MSRRGVPITSTPEGDALELSRSGAYARWRALAAPGPAELDALRAEVSAWPDAPLVSVVMPVYETDPKVLRAAIDSVRAQTYARWELCIADDCSTRRGVAELLGQVPGEDRRIRVVRRTSQGGIAAASNDALAMAGGELVALLDHDDLLAPHALQAMAAAMRDPEVGLAHSDEDKLLLDGTLGEPFLKPDWSPSLLLSVNYVCHLTVIRREIVERIGGFRDGFEGAQDHDLVLRVVDTGCRVAHVPDVLYTWRMTRSSTAASARAKPHASESARRAIEDSLGRRGERARVVPAGVGGWQHVRRELTRRPTVLVAVLDGGDATEVRACLDSLHARTTYASIQTLVAPPEASRRWDALEGCLSGHAGDILVLLDGGLRVTTGAWLEGLLEQLSQAGVAAAGLKIAPERGVPCHQGIAINRFGQLATAVDVGEYVCLPYVVREVAAVGGGCLAVKRERVAAAGGFRSVLGGLAAEAELCVRLRANGDRIVYTPLAELRCTGRARHHESLTADDAARLRSMLDGERDPYTPRAVATFRPLRLLVSPARQPGSSTAASAAAPG